MRVLSLQVLSLVLWLPAVLQAAAPVQISEFAAAGHQGLRDEDGDSPDWIELRNFSVQPVNLEGWVLSEESRRVKSWLVPSTNVPSGACLVLFASGKDRRVPGQPLHTNFKLPTAGGVLVLRSPAGEVSRVDRYPVQVPGVSFGLAGSPGGGADQLTLIGPEAALRFFLPTDDRLGTNWLSPDFDDSRWRRGRNGIGYDTRGDYHELLRTDLGQGMVGHCPGLYLRYPFTLTNAAAVTSMTLHAQYDDGYVAWLSGSEVARGNAPATTRWNSLASATRPDDKAVIPEDAGLNILAAHLVNGTNWLTIHILNASLQSRDLLFRAILDMPAPADASREAPTTPTYTYLTKPTPGTANALAACSGPRIELLPRQPSRPPRFDEQILVTAKIAPMGAPISEVRLCYRVMGGGEKQVTMSEDRGSGDDPGGGIYQAVIPAKTAKPGQMLRYCVMAKDAKGGISRWPLFADRRDYSAYEGTVIADPSVRTRLPVLDLFNAKGNSSGGRRASANASLFFDGELYDNVSISLHGQISRGFPKQSYNIHFPRDHYLRCLTNQARVNKIELLANYADKSKIRNTLAYEMIAASGSVGHFAFPVRVQQNGRFFSVAEVVENGDERWLRRVGRDPQGALYKMNNNLSSTHGAQKKTRKDEPARDLASFVSALAEGRPIESRAAFAYGHIDIPQCISYFVAMTLISSDDHGHKNYYLYRDSRHSGEWALFPWDVDLSWGRNWTGQYFNETLFVDNPLDLYRNGHSKPPNRLYNLFFQYPEFRQMYLRRLRTVMDELLQPPGTPAQALIIEKRIRQLMNLLDPPGIKPSDADLDNAAGNSWGKPASMRQEAQRIIDEHLPGRRQFLFKSSRARLFGEPIPASQPGNVSTVLASISAEGSAPEQSVCLTNTNQFAVDLSGWTLAGAGIQHRFRPGTVLPSGKSIYVVADVATFRHKASENGGDPTPFAQGDWRGGLRTKPGPLQLSRKDGSIAATRDLP